ncbi:hypothetical protein GRW41_03140 [Escherichia coli]|nr:hypothetical protein [Escherichia coli]
MLPSETMIWQPEFTDKTLSRKTGAVQASRLSVVKIFLGSVCFAPIPAFSLSKSRLM